MHGILQTVCWIWALPWTVVGLLIGGCNWLGGGAFQRQGWVIEIHGPLVRWLFARFPNRPAAMTLGHTVLGLDARTLARTRRHELVHVRQYERWGPLFIPLYLIYSLWAWCRGLNPYLDNPLEQEAFRADSVGEISPPDVDNCPEPPKAL